MSDKKVIVGVFSATAREEVDHSDNVRLREAAEKLGLTVEELVEQTKRAVTKSACLRGEKPKLVSDGTVDIGEPE